MPTFASILRPLLVLFTLIMLSLVAIQPFTYGKMPLTDDGTLHLYRIIALDYSLQYDNPIYPRYSSALAYGYGSPLFNYFSPVAYYLPRTLHILGMSFIQAWLSGMIVYIWIAMLGAYLLASKWTNMMGGFVGAVAYVYAPYMLYDSVSRGTITEYSSLAILPLVLYAMTRLSENRTRFNFGLAVICFSIFIPLHTIITLHGSILIAVYCLLLCFLHPHKRTNFFTLLSVGILSLGITCFFWLPALSETKFIKLNAITDNLPSLDVTNHLRPLNEILALPIAIDPQRLLAPIPITLSWLSIPLGIVAAILAFKFVDKKLRYLTWFWVLVVLVTIFMNTQMSAWFWKNIPFLNYTQFAWRTLGIGSLALSVLSTLGVHLLVSQITSKTAQNSIYAVFIVLLSTYSFSWTYRPYIELQADSVLDAQSYERKTGEVSLSSYSEYLPIWNEQVLDGFELVEAWSSNFPIMRFLDNENTDFQITHSVWNGTSAQFDMTAINAQTVTLNWLYVMGWKARIDGVDTTVYPSSPDGLISVDVPMGSNSIEIFLDYTPTQLLSQIVSFFSFFLLIVIYILWKPEEKRGAIPVRWLPTATISQFALLGFVVFCVKFFVIDQTNNSFHFQFFSSDWQNVTTQIIKANFNNEIELVGFEKIDTVKSGYPFHMNVFWRLPQGVIEKNYASKYSLRDDQGIVVSEVTHYQIAGLDTKNWIPNYYLEEKVNFPVDSTLPPSTYTLEVSVFDTKTLETISIINATGNPESNKIVLANLKIERSDKSLHGSDVTQIMDMVPIRLIETSKLPEKLASGDFFTINWIWQALKDLDKDYSIRLTWVKNDTNQYQEEFVSPVYGFPTSQWEKGDGWKGTYQFFVPASLATGKYELEIQLFDDNQMLLETYTMGSIQVQTPIRNFTEPTPSNLVDIQWQSGIQMIGFDVTENQLTIYWNTKKQISENLHWFAHVLNSENIIVAQIDEIPIGWTRPTTSWSTNEYITTNFVFADLLSGKYSIQIGWYESQFNQRVLITTGADFYKLPIEIEVQ